jgi:hypothetical protein
MFGENGGNRGLMGNKLFDYDEYQNGNKRSQALTNDSEQRHHKKCTVLTVKYLQRKYSQTKAGYGNVLFLYNIVNCKQDKNYGNIRKSIINLG